MDVKRKEEKSRSAKKIRYTCSPFAFSRTREEEATKKQRFSEEEIPRIELTEMELSNATKESD